MGWDYQHKLVQCPNPEARRCEHCGEVVWNLDETVAPCKGFPCYSTRIEDAWKLAEKVMSSTDYGFGVTGKMRSGIGPEFTATFVFGHDVRMSIAATAPLAICMAAMKVVGK